MLRALLHQGLPGGVVLLRRVGPAIQAQIQIAGGRIDGTGHVVEGRKVRSQHGTGIGHEGAATDGQAAGIAAREKDASPLSHRGIPAADSQAALAQIEGVADVQVPSAHLCRTVECGGSGIQGAAGDVDRTAEVGCDQGRSPGGLGEGAVKVGKAAAGDRQVSVVDDVAVTGKYFGGRDGGIAIQAHRAGIISLDTYPLSACCGKGYLITERSQRYAGRTGRSNSYRGCGAVGDYRSRAREADLGIPAGGDTAGMPVALGRDIDSTAVDVDLSAFTQQTEGISSFLLAVCGDRDGPVLGAEADLGVFSQRIRADGIALRRPCRKGYVAGGLQFAVAVPACL